MLAVGDSFVSLTNLDSVSKLNVFLRLFAQHLNVQPGE